jgi:hypothetical protein
VALVEQPVASIRTAQILLSYDDTDLAILGVHVLSGTQAIRVTVSLLAGAQLLTRDFAANTNTTFNIARSAGLHMLQNDLGELDAPYRFAIGEL